MLVHTFDYCDAKGRKTTRTVAIHTLPTTLYGGTDISELEPADMAQYVIELDKLKTAYASAVAKLNEDFDLNHRFRQFKPEQMTNVTTEDI